jgi:hypothetical protein
MPKALENKHKSWLSVAHHLTPFRGSAFDRISRKPTDRYWGEKRTV